MRILWEGCPGSLIVCPLCGWTLAYSPADIIYNHYIQCPNADCREKIKVPLDLAYEGITNA